MKILNKPDDSSSDSILVTIVVTISICKTFLCRGMDNYLGHKILFSVDNGPITVGENLR